MKEGSVYVGESSRTIFERSREHWNDWRSRSDKSHILKHQDDAHEGNQEPRFMMRTVRFYRSALSRQVGEAVRIMLRGGAGSILNSKSEFDRCKIPRLILEEQDEEEIRKAENQELERDREALEEQARLWGEQKTNERREVFA